MKKLIIARDNNNLIITEEKKIKEILSRLEEEQKEACFFIGYNRTESENEIVFDRNTATYIFEK